MEIIFAYLIAALFPLLSLAAIYTLNLYSTSQIEVVFLCLGWGLAAFFIAVQVHRFILGHTQIALLNLSRYVAPLTEETLKAALLIYLVRRPIFNYFVDGAVYGFAIGIGFAVIENFSYIANHEAMALSVAFWRAFSISMVHAVASAVIGIALGLGRFQQGALGRLFFISAGWAAAVLIHGGFNNMVSRVGIVWQAHIYAALAGLVGTVFIAWMIRRGLKEERDWIDEMLGLADQVTRNESRLVLRLAETGSLLAPIVEHFGKRKAAQIGRLLAVQAQLGVLRKTLQKTPNEKMRLDAEGQISILQHEMSILRKRIGIYPMLFLRSVFPEDNFSVWNRLESAVETPAPAAGNGDFSMTDVLQGLSDVQRQVMNAIIRNPKRATANDLKAEIDSRGQTLSESAISAALDGLLAAGKISRVAGIPNAYEVKFKRRAGLNLDDNIWSRLNNFSTEVPSGDSDVWDGLKNLLIEQAQTPKISEGKNLWLNLAQRIPQK
jgi:RsiW-degrading membrane proteinase PrsW (M82 family)